MLSPLWSGPTYTYSRSDCSAHRKRRRERERRINNSAGVFPESCARTNQRERARREFSFSGGAKRTGLSLSLLFYAVPFYPRVDRSSLVFSSLIPYASASRLRAEILSLYAREITFFFIRRSYEEISSRA